MSESPPELDAAAGEKPMPIWVFLLVFLGSPIMMGIVLLVIILRDQIASHPLATALVVAHAVSGLALLIAYLILRRRRG